MSINASALRLMREKGLTLDDVVEIAAAMETRRDPTAADRQQRRRDKVKSETSRRDVTRDAPLNDIYSNPPEPSDAKASPPPLSDRVVSAWNAGPAARGAAKATKLDAGRRKHLAARVREHGDEAVFTAIRGIEVSDFHCGIGEKSYRTNLGWLLKSPEHFLAAMERAESAKPATAKQWTDEEKRAYREKVAGRAQGFAALPDPPPRPPPMTHGPTAIADLLPNIAHGHH